jgi:thioredoxin 1
MNNIIDITDDNFEEEVLNSKDYVLVDFWAEWCGPCKMISPILEDIATVYTEKPLKICKLNIDQNEETAPKYGIRGIPTILLFKDGNNIATKVGAFSKAELEDFLETNT